MVIRRTAQGFLIAPIHDATAPPARVPITRTHRHSQTLIPSIIPLTILPFNLIFEPHVEKLRVINNPIKSLTLLTLNNRKITARHSSISQNTPTLKTRHRNNRTHLNNIISLESSTHSRTHRNKPKKLILKTRITLRERPSPQNNRVRRRSIPNPQPRHDRPLTIKSTNQQKPSSATH